MTTWEWLAASLVAFVSGALCGYWNGHRDGWERGYEEAAGNEGGITGFEGIEAMEEEDYF